MNNEVIKNIFKAYDVRGKVGVELTTEVAESIGKALATWLPNEGAVAVCRDMRPDSQSLAEAMAKGLRSGGRDVIDIGEVTSDMIYFAVGNLKLAGGAMITASHNPGADNGIKLCREEAKPIGELSGLFEIRDLVIANNFSAAATKGQYEQKDVTEDWIQHVISFIDVDKLQPIKIAVDAGNGMAGKIFPELEPYVPFEVVEMYFDLDGTFPNHIANPLVPENLVDLQAAIKANDCYAGIAFDGDGDRAVLVDETGTALSGGVISAMLSDYFLEKFPGSSIVYDVRNSRSVPEIIAEKGGKPVEQIVGHSPIKQKMREVDAPFGGEFSGHYYFRDNYYADSGLIAATISLYVAALRGKKLSELRQEYTRYSAIPETNFTVEDKAGIIAKLAEVFNDGKQEKKDGLSVTYSDGRWFNVRPSNTEPLLRLNAEARSQKELDKVVAKVKDIIQQ
jgi:phosphomannomutase